MTAPPLDPAVGITVRFGLALLLAWAATHKLRDLRGFRTALAQYDLLPQGWVGPVSTLLVSAELGIGASLLVPRLGVVAALAAAALLAVYAAAIIVNLWRGRRDIDCGCAGLAQRQPLSVALAVRNGVLIGAALAGACPAAGRALTWIDGCTIGAALATLALLYLAVDGLLASAPRIAALVYAVDSPDVHQSPAVSRHHA